MTKISDLHRRWRKGADYKAAYDALGEEFDLGRALIEARAAAGLSQSQLAKKMKTSQSYIARIEGGKVRPSTDALERFAQATRTPPIDHGTHAATHSDLVPRTLSLASNQATFIDT
jgi:transcriptional regulator with XRE-family HTH domain